MPTRKKKTESSAKGLRVIAGGKAKAVLGRSARNSSAMADVAGEEARFHVLFENASDAILVVNTNTMMITEVNHALCELTGYLKNEVENKSLEMLAPEEKSLPARSFGLEPLHVENSGFFEDLVIRRKDGFSRFVSLSVRTLDLQGTPTAMCILRDIGEKKTMERELITKHTELREAYVELERANVELKSMQETLVQSGKLAALGELAAGIAHELNQPLTAVKGFAQESKSLLRQAQPKAAVIENELSSALNYLDEVISGSQKMEKIISHLRNFTRKSTEDFRLVNVHDVIEESLLMLDRQFQSRGIKVSREFSNELPQIYCNPFQLEQVFINLATNARDAIEARAAGSGNLKIRTSLAGKKMIEIRFEDDGVGMSEQTRGKIFNPFFTTKEVGKGMGLGLSISYGILNKLNASIMVESAMGRGSVFVIKVPVDYRQH